MKIKFKSITAKNFLSYGNAEINFEFGKSPFTIIVGENGSGKSALIVDALHFVIYGKIIRKGVTKDCVYNNINGGKCEVTLEMDVNDIPYTIGRGLKPDYLEFFKDGKEQDERASKTLVQQEIESLLGFDQNTFRNLCILSLNGSKSFMDLNPDETRSVVENLLGIQIYSQMLEKAKTNIKDNKDKLKILVKDYDLYKGLVSDNKDKLTKANEIKNNFEKNKIKQLKELYINKIALEEKKNSYELQIKEWGGIIPDFNSTEYDRQIIVQQIKIDWIQKVASEFAECLNYNKREYDFIKTKQIIDERNELNKWNTKLTFFNETKNCPICNSKLTEKHRKIECDRIKKEEINRLEVQIDLSERQMKFYQDNINFFVDEYQSWQVYKKEIEKLQKELYTSKGVEEENYNQTLKNYEYHKNDQNVIKNNISRLEIEIKSLLERMKIIKDQTMSQVDSLIDESKVKEYEDKFKSITDNKEKTENEILYYEFIKELLSDDGIKAQVIKNDLPFINNSINKYLVEFGVNYGVKFNEQFELELTGYSKRGLVYYSLSEGEKKRVDLSILLSFIKLAKSKNSISCNILVIDELLDNALDSTGREYIIRLLTNMINGGIIDSVYIISHNINLTLPNCIRIEVRKEGEFSKLIVEE